MKTIIRHSHLYTSPLCVAGAYSVNQTSTLTALFALTIRKVLINMSAFDSVTGQGIGVTGYLQYNVGYRDDPGFNYAGTAANTFYYPLANGNMIAWPSYITISPNDVLTFYWRPKLFTVTANDIQIYGLIDLEYECPEDYLSVEPFNIKI